jgi:hypothetical protein
MANTSEEKSKQEHQARPDATFYLPQGTDYYFASEDEGHILAFLGQ